jgi:hypothetical protein
MIKNVNKPKEPSGVQKVPIHEFLNSKTEIEKPKRPADEVIKDLNTFSDAVKSYNESKAKLMEEVQLEEKAPNPPKEEIVERKITPQEIADFDTAIYSEDLTDRLNNTNVRKAIESKLKPLNFEDLLIHGEVHQEIPLREGFTIVLRSVKPGEDLAVKKLMYGMVGSQSYITSRFSVMNLALSLISINSQQIPSHLDQQGRFDEDFFNKKLEKLMWSYSAHIIRFIIINYMWFQDRVDKCISESVNNLGNG